jgi:glycosyltransferase involved in cell wall biosynthesis
MLNIGLVFPRLPPAFDAIGEHTHRLAKALSVIARVRVFAEDPAPQGAPYAHSLLQSTPADLPGAVASHPVDWLVVQYNPFSYARRGIGTGVRRALQEIRSRSAATRTALLIHEKGSDPDSVKLRIYGAAHRWELHRMLPRFDHVITTTGAWTKVLEDVSGSKVPLLPVGSNINRQPITRNEARRALGIGDSLVVSTFGKMHNSRLGSWVRDAAVRPTDKRLSWVHIGPESARVSEAQQVTGVVDEQTVSLYLLATDLFLSPFRRGVAERRGSVAAAFSHGLPVLTTIGPDTGKALRAAEGALYRGVPCADRDGFLGALQDLLDQSSQRDQLGGRAREYHDRFLTWPALAERLLGILNSWKRHGD